MLDALLLDLDGESDLTATTVGSWHNISGVTEGSYDVFFPSAFTGTGTPAVVVKLDFSDDASTVKENQESPSIEAGEDHYFMRFAPRRKYVRATFTVTGTTPNLGAVVAGISKGSHRLSRAG